MIWVVDASVALRWFIEEEAHPHADEVLRRVVQAPERFAVPELFAFEVFAVLQRVHPKANDVFTRGIVPLLESGILRHPMTAQLASLADRYTRMGLTGYDACYAALAYDVNGKWLTFDKKAHRLIRSEKLSAFLGDGVPPEMEPGG